MANGYDQRPQDWHDYYGLDTTNGGQLRFEANGNNPQDSYPRIRNYSSYFYSNGADGKMTGDVASSGLHRSGGKLTGYIDGELDAPS